MANPSTLPQSAANAALPTPGVKNLLPQRQVHLNVDQAGPPSNVYVTLDDTLRMVILDHVGGATIIAECQYLLPNGQLVIEEERGVSLAAPTALVVKFSNFEGYLIRCSITAIGVASGRQVFGIFDILRAGVGSTIQLAQGFLANFNKLSWPGGVYEAQSGGQGFLSTFTVANPAAGADFASPLFGSRRTKVTGIIATLTTSAAVANRLVSLVVNDGTRNGARFLASAVQAASLAITYCFSSAGSSFGPVGGFQHIGIPFGVTGQAAWNFKTLTANIDVADQWSAIVFSVEQWFDA